VIKDLAGKDCVEDTLESAAAALIANRSQTDTLARTQDRTLSVNGGNGPRQQPTIAKEGGRMIYLMM